MSLLRRVRPPLHRGGLPVPADEDMPPRPVRQPYRSLGPDTVPKLAFGWGPVDPEFDPCGRPHPPLKTGSDEGEQT